MSEVNMTSAILHSLFHVTLRTFKHSYNSEQLNYWQTDRCKVFMM